MLFLTGGSAGGWGGGGRDQGGEARGWGDDNNVGQRAGRGRDDQRYDDGGWGGGSRRGGGGGDRRRSEGRGGGRGGGGWSEGRGRGRGGGGGGWSNRGGQRDDLSKEEIWEKQRERQAIDAERQSWLAVQNERYPDSEYLFGVSPILAALRTKRRDMYVLYVQDTMDMDKRKDRKAAEEIQRLADENGCVLETVDKGRLNVMSGDRPHQGFILQCKPLDFVDISQMEKVSESDARPPMWLVLDEVMDPQNFGALVRSAYFLGCDGIITCSKNSATISPTMSKASAGAVELQPIHSTKNLMRFLETSKENGWQVLISRHPLHFSAVRSIWRRITLRSFVYRGAEFLNHFCAGYGSRSFKGQRWSCGNQVSEQYRYPQSNRCL